MNKHQFVRWDFQLSTYKLALKISLIFSFVYFHFRSMESESPKIWVSVKYEDYPPLAALVSNDPKLSGNIHKFIETLCA